MFLRKFFVGYVKVDGGTKVFMFRVFRGLEKGVVSLGEVVWGEVGWW